MKRHLFWTVLLLIMMLPVRAMAAETPTDGRYRIEVTLTGGSGRATVESPAQLTVADGQATAVLIWSSPYYEYMRLDGTTYYPVNTDGNAMFEIPVLLDEDMPVSAQTVAMSRPHEIDYTLRFDGATLRPLSGDRPAPAQPGTALWAAALIILVILGFSIVLLRRKAKA
ncbi:MAG: hypothetical protein RBT41_01885 [Clostridia bacterium]|jgi:hypothetical protein|nr:hypothetical protein [Clostridia bacterium]